ncbi:MAG TPA: hypothetical protein VM716_09680 [Gemmatimonadales bacterium]|nr:hypothetical protein [Gemmatimonadales bacterium]
MSPTRAPAAGARPGSSIQQWARLQADYDCSLRRGAWYRVLSVSQLEVVVEVHDKPVMIARPFLELVAVPPRRWTVIERATVSRREPRLGKRYAVCPSCRERVPLAGRPSRMKCRRCGGVFGL